MRHSFWKHPAKSLVLLASLLCLSVPSSSYAASSSKNKTKLEVGSFNIQVFGESKFGKPFIRQTILSIISRYDIIFIQEIRDDKNKAIYDLLKELNKETGRDYHALVSSRMGRGDMKEQYAYFFDSEIVKHVDSYVFKDTLDEFSREPYVARFSSLGHEFTLAGIHVDPNEVRTELPALAKVHRDVKKRFDDNDLLIMGDLNADCIYYKPGIEGFDFFDEEVKVLVHDDEDTTVSPKSCAYDRVLGFGPFLSHVSEAKAFNYQEQYGFDLANSKLISDHYPIEFTIEASSSIETNSEEEKAEVEARLPSIPLTQETIETSAESCGIESYLTQSGYCYGIFEKGRRRVADECCAR